MFYRNISNATKTFYGITFNPGDEKEVPGYINTGDFIAIAPPEKPVPVAAKATPAKKEQEKVEPAKVEPEKKEPVKNTTQKTEKKEETVDGTDNS